MREKEIELKDVLKKNHLFCSFFSKKIKLYSKAFQHI